VPLVGIDPGLSGAVAVLATDGTLQALCDTPTLTLKTTCGTKQADDIPGPVALLASSRGPQSPMSSEEAPSMPGRGRRSRLTCGMGMGLWLGVLTALPLPQTRGRPQTWKRALGWGQDKEQARRRAMHWFPRAALRRTRDHGRAEAFLLAWYGWQHVAGYGPAAAAFLSHSARPHRQRSEGA
jgi:crossover junction endodeoxyribonuclease RuvC